MQISPTSQGNFSALTSNPSRRADGSQADAPLVYSNQEWLNTEAGKALAARRQENDADLAAAYDTQARQAEMTQQMNMEADTVFRRGDQILAVLYKDGSVYWHDNAGVNISQLSEANRHLSQNEYRMAMRQSLIQAFGANAVSTSYGLHQKAPTQGDLMAEERSYYARIGGR